MAELEEAIVSRLEGFAGLSVLVVKRIYPLVIPVTDKTYPAVTYQRVAAERWSAIASDVGIAQPTIQIDSWGRSYTEAKSVAKQVRLALQRWDAVEAGVTVLDATIESEIDDYDDEVEKFRVSQDYVFTHRE